MVVKPLEMPRSQVILPPAREGCFFQDGQILWSYFKPEFGSVPGAKLAWMSQEVRING